MKKIFPDEKNIPASQRDLNVAFAENAENVAAALLRISAEFESLKRRVEYLERGLVATE